MKNIRLHLKLAALFFLLLSGCSESKKPISGKLPEVLFRNLQNSQISLNSYSGNLILLVFWATWCQPCLMEIPSLISLNNRFKGQNFKIVSILTDNPPTQQIRQIANEFGINYDILLATADQTQQFGGINAIPTSFLISSEGKILDKMEGLVPEAELENKIRQFLLPNN